MLSLPLFMLRVRTDYPHNTTSADNFALTTHTFDGRAYLHFALISEPISNGTDKTVRAAILSIEIVCPFIIPRDRHAPSTDTSR